MKHLTTLYRAIARNKHANTLPLLPAKSKRDAAGPPPQNFGEVIGYLAWYLKQMPETHDSRANHLNVSLDYLMAWLRNELVNGRLPIRVRGEGWSL